MVIRKPCPFKLHFFSHWKSDRSRRNHEQIGLEWKRDKKLFMTRQRGIYDNKIMQTYINKMLYSVSKYLYQFVSCVVHNLMWYVAVLQWIIYGPFEIALFLHEIQYLKVDGKVNKLACSVCFSNNSIHIVLITFLPVNWH